MLSLSIIIGPREHACTHQRNDLSGDDSVPDKSRTRVVCPEAQDGVVPVGNVDGVLERGVDQFPGQQALPVQIFHVFQCDRFVNLPRELSDNTCRATCYR